jgi:hypothetical protein
MKAIGDHLSLAWNYISTLRAFQKYARSQPELIKRHNHFFFTITRAIWDALFLKLSHCSDDSKRARAIGFPKLFKQLRAYQPDDPALQANVKKQETALQRLATQRKVEKWREQAVAHHTEMANSPQFYEQNKCTLDELEKLVARHEAILHALSFPIFNLGFRIRDHGPRAHRAVNRLMAIMKEGRTSADTLRFCRSGKNAGAT